MQVMIEHGINTAMMICRWHAAHQRSTHRQCRAAHQRRTLTVVRSMLVRAAPLVVFQPPQPTHGMMRDPGPMTRGPLRDRPPCTRSGRIRRHFPAARGSHDSHLTWQPGYPGRARAVRRGARQPAGQRRLRNRRLDGLVGQRRCPGHSRSRIITAAVGGSITASRSGPKGIAMVSLSYLLRSRSTARSLILSGKELLPWPPASPINALARVPPC